jgi:hypothetical protein
MIASLFFDLPELRLGHQTTVVVEIVVVSMFGGNTYLGEIPRIRYLFIELFSVFTLVQELIGKFVLFADPSLDFLVLCLFHESIRIWHRNFGTVSSDIL